MKTDVDAQHTFKNTIEPKYLVKAASSRKVGGRLAEAFSLKTRENLALTPRLSHMPQTVKPKQSLRSTFIV